MSERRDVLIRAALIGLAAGAVVAAWRLLAGSGRGAALERRARGAIDRAHAEDPKAVGGEGDEIDYADAVERWVQRLVPRAGLALRLAARAQHLERWAVARTDFPEGRGGYLRWRQAVHARQGARALEILTDAGVRPELAGRVSQLVAKRTPKGDAEAQALEDAACLVFLETELMPFARQHPREKVIDVLRKTWRKMSPRGHEEALGLDLPAEAAELVRAALQPPPDPPDPSEPV